MVQFSDYVSVKYIFNIIFEIWNSSTIFVSQSELIQM